MPLYLQQSIFMAMLHSSCLPRAYQIRIHSQKKFVGAFFLCPSVVLRAQVLWCGIVIQESETSTNSLEINFTRFPWERNNKNASVLHSLKLRLMCHIKNTVDCVKSIRCGRINCHFEGASVGDNFHEFRLLCLWLISPINRAQLPKSESCANKDVTWPYAVIYCIPALKLARCSW